MRAFHRPVPVSELRWRCPPSAFRGLGRGGRSVSEVIGQDDAMAALRLGLELYGPGFNVYVAGLPGVGKTSLVETLLREMTPRCAPAQDRVYVNDFVHPERPSLVELERGRGPAFVKEVDDFVQSLGEAIRALAADEAYAKRREEIVSRSRVEERTLVDALEAEAAKQGFALASAGPTAPAEVFWILGPGEGGARPELVGVDDFDAAVRAGRLTPDALDSLRAQHADLRSRLAAVLREAHRIARRRREALEALDREVAQGIVRDAAEDLRRGFPLPSVTTWLEDVERAVVGRFQSYARALAEPGEGDGSPARAEVVLREFRANLLLEPKPQERCPFIVERNPTWTNVFGQIEREVDAGVARSDFLHVRAGSLLRADGGYLILQATDVLPQPGVWQELKRVLRHQRLEIRQPEAAAAIAPVALRPEPIRVNVKVVLIGDERTYLALLDADPEFAETFKVKTTFDEDMALSREALRRYAAFVRRLEVEERLRPASAGGLAALAEEAVREAGRRGRISLRFGRIGDLLREASYEADRLGSSRIDAEHVLAAKAAAACRHAARERRVRDAIREGLVLIAMSGKRVGEVNGLAVYDFGDSQFGKVARITAAVGAGGDGVINVEREVSLSAATYDKGVHILEGYLRHVFARAKAVSFTASLVFEQSYGGIAGDSATCAETCAILSALSDIPLRQDLAVTGSMNQHGEVQAVGDVNDKIEGFFDVCSDRGLTGTQGVILPRSNVKDLMLRPDVVAACRAGRFAVYAIDRIEEGIELLTGVPAGLTKEPDKFKKGSVFAAVADNLVRLSS